MEIKEIEVEGINEYVESSFYCGKDRLGLVTTLTFYFITHPTRCFPKSQPLKKLVSKTRSKSEVYRTNGVVNYTTQTRMFI